jgi:hypothetical protein
MTRHPGRVRQQSARHHADPNTRFEVLALIDAHIIKLREALRWASAKSARSRTKAIPAAPRDAGYVEHWGARVRGSVFEEQFSVPAMRAC